jgi:hypothetical protein
MHQSFSFFVIVLVLDFFGRENEERLRRTRTTKINPAIRPPPLVKNAMPLVNPGSPPSGRRREFSAARNWASA